MKVSRPMISVSTTKFFSSMAVVFMTGILLMLPISSAMAQLRASTTLGLGLQTQGGAQRSAVLGDAQVGIGGTSAVQGQGACRDAATTGRSAEGQSGGRRGR